MLVCSVSLLRRQAAIAVNIAETAAALDSPGTGNVVFATLVDDPASVVEHVDAFLGQIMLEAANAATTLNAGLTYATAIVESGTAAELASASRQTSATMAETVAAGSAQDATKTAGGTVTAAVAEATTAADSLNAVIISSFNGILALNGPIMPMTPQPTVIFIQG